MRINSNISSMSTQGALFKTSRSMGKSLQKLSTGLRINSSADDAAGLAVSENLRTQVRGLGQANKNTQDAIAMLNIADGALSEQADILQRMRELIIQAKNDTLTQTERNYLGDEFGALGDELDRISKVTNYNGMQLFADNSTTVGTDPKSSGDATSIWGNPADAIFGANDDGGATYFNIFVGANYSANDIAAFDPSGSGHENWDKNAENIISMQMGQMDAAGLFSKSTNATFDGWSVIKNFGAANAFSADTFLQQLQFGDIHGKLNTMLQLIDGNALDSLAAGAGAWYTGTNESGLARVNKMRSYVGAMVNRLEHNVNNLQTSQVNQQAAESYIRDVDFAKETTEFTKNQILTQSATSMLAQSNMKNYGVLSLLK